MAGDSWKKEIKKAEWKTLASFLFYCLFNSKACLADCQGLVRFEKLTFSKMPLT